MSNRYSTTSATNSMHPRSTSTRRTTNRELKRSTATGRTSNRELVRSTSTGRTTNREFVRSTSTRRTTNRELVRSTATGHASNRELVRSTSTGRTTNREFVRSTSAGRTSNRELVQSTSTGRTTNRELVRSTSTRRTTNRELVRSTLTGRTTNRELVQSTSTGRTTNRELVWSTSTGDTANREFVRSTSTGHTTNTALVQSTNNNWSQSSSTNRRASNGLGWSNSTARTGRQQEFQQRSSVSSDPRNGEKEHWSHPGCILRWVDHHKPMYNCNGCLMDGMGIRYRCNKHDFDLHQECMFAHPGKKIVFQDDNCTFFNESRGNCTYCDACGFKVEGFVFHSDRGRDFHPKCAKLERKIDIENIKYKLYPTLLSNCQWCKKTRAPGADKEIPGWAYVSSSGSGFHVNCVFWMAMQVRRTGGDSTLTFQPNTGSRSRIGINSKLLEKLGIIGVKILLSTLLGPLGGVVHVIDLLPSY